MPSANATAADLGQRTFSASFVRFPGDDAAPWFFPPDHSFVVRLPAPRRKRRSRGSPARKPDPWQPMAGRLELVADVARQCARAARGRDPKTFDRLMVAVREALLDAIGVYNTNDEYMVNTSGRFQ